MGKWKLAFVPKKFYGLIADLFEKKQAKIRLQPRQAAELNAILTSAEVKDKQKSRKLLEQFEKETNKSGEDLMKIKENLLASYITN